MSADGHGAVGPAGAGLLADLADATGLTGAFADALRGLRPRGTGQALAQIPVAHRYGTPILVRAEGAGGAKGFLAHLRALGDRDIQTSFSVGHPIIEPVRTTR